MQQNKTLGSFALAMTAVAAIISLRNLPLSAVYGLSSAFYYVVAALIFFIPIALVVAELATSWPKPGGTYIWVSEAFGKKWGFYALWIAWMGIIAWFPAVLAFTATMLGHLLEPWFPGLAENKIFCFLVMLSIFWGSTFLNFLGMRASTWVSTVGVLAGTVIPGALIILLGIGWALSGQPTYISFNLSEMIPEFRLENMVLFSGILLALVGVEVPAYHVKDVANPTKDYPKALLIAVIIILGISILGTLAIAMVVPQQDISLLSGLIQAFTEFFAAFHMSWVVPVLALLALIGSLAGINAWTVGPAKGLLVSAEDGFLPTFLKKVNHLGVPTGMLIFQAIIGSVLSLLFLWMNSSSAAYWILTAISAQFAVVQYGLIFAAALALRYLQPKVQRVYRVPGNLYTMWIICMLGIFACIFGFLIVFLPPNQLETGDKSHYQTLLILVLLVLSLLPFVLSAGFFTRDKK